MPISFISFPGSDTCEEAVIKAVEIFGPSINIEIIEHGKVRPEEGHEHFGFLDGVSQPALKSVAYYPLSRRSVLT